MSVICSDSDNEMDCLRIDSYSEVYKQGRSGPTTCFSPKSHSVPAFRSRMRPLRLMKSNTKRSRSSISNHSDDRRRKSISSRYEGNLTEPGRRMLPTTLENSTAVQQCVSDLTVGHKPDNDYASTNVEEELVLADATLLSQPRSDMLVLEQDVQSVDSNSMTPVRFKTPMSTTTISADLSLRVNQAQTPSLGNRTFSRRLLSNRTPTKATPRRRRKKLSPPLPPYKYLMTDDIPEEDISSYSSDDTHAIRTKGSMMFESFRLAGLENRTDKMLEIEKWRLDSSSEWPPCT